MHPVTKSRTPFGLFFDIMDYKCVAIDGKPALEAGGPMLLRLDSHGRVFVKTSDTNNLWEKVGELPEALNPLLWNRKKSTE